MIFKLVARTSVWIGMMAVVLFAAAGSWRWLPGWAFVAVFALGSFAFGAWLLVRDPALLESRLNVAPRADQPVWDRVFLLGFIVFWFAWLALMAADARRWHVSPVPGWLQVVGGFLIVAGFAATVPVFAANSFAGPAVEVQTSRGQRVIDSGPYAWVRHPMYSAAILYLTGMPLLFGSWIGLVGSAIFVIGIALRARGEERKLARELSGYADYLSRVRWRLVPYLW